MSMIQQIANGWDPVHAGLDLLPRSAGLNIAYEAVDRHATGALRNAVALSFMIGDDARSEITYGELRRRTDRFANMLVALGMTKGDRIFTLTGRIPELYFAALGTLKRGAVFSPLYVGSSTDHLVHCLGKGAARILITTQALHQKHKERLWKELPGLRHVLLTDAPTHMDEHVRSLPQLMEEAAENYTIPPTAADDPAYLHFTSGTTGMAKGVIHVHRSVVMHAITGRMVLGLQPRDIYWCTADPGWATCTFYGMIAPLVCGAQVVVDMEELDPQRWCRLLAREHVNVWYTTATSIRRLRRAALDIRRTHDLSALRTMLSVGEPLDRTTMLWAQETFGVPVLDSWWQTETGGIMIANLEDMLLKPGSMGKPLPGIFADVAQITTDGIKVLQGPDRRGQLILHQDWPSQFVTYLNEEDRYLKRFREDMYLTGDIVRIDADGYFWFIGREEEMIDLDGRLIGPNEIEAPLMEHPAVAEAAVIAKPAPLGGNAIKAFIVPNAARVNDVRLHDELMTYANRILGSKIAIHELEIVTDLPRTRNGKVMRRLLLSGELGLSAGDLSELEGEAAGATVQVGVRSKNR